LIDTEGNVLGAIQIDTLDQRSRFREADLEVLAAVASQAAIAITNAELYEQALQQRAIQRDLDLAKRVQASLLPASRPAINGLEFYDYYQAANQIGGDYFDYVELPDGRLAVIIADVSGHGIAAALLMARLSAEARFCLATIDGPGKVVSRLNQMMCEDQWDDGFVTLVLAVIRPDTNQITLVIAGHSAPLVREASGTVKEIGAVAAGLPLGVAEGLTYEETTYDLQPGDLLVTYTDGIPESMDSTNRAYGNKRVQTLLKENADGPARFGQALLSDLRHFVGDTPQGDDMCLVCFERSA
jgi:serine phosphatase RsbU (regulator of sigma subunit)